MVEQEETLENYEQKLLNLILKAENNTLDFSSSKPLDILKEVFGHNGFKPQQLEIITRILNKEGNTLGIMPTGGGKSVCFQIPALTQENLTIVISPLIALMKDQIDNLTKKNIYTAFFVNSSISEDTKEKILDLVEKKKVKLLYLAPESLKSERILEVLKKLDIGLFVIDEAHCISTWGHNFRPDYLKLPDIIEELNHPKILALTATATREVEEDIQKQLKTKCKVFKASFDRPNLYMDVIPLEKNVKKELFLVSLLKQLKGSTIVFVSYRTTSEKISEILNSNGIGSVHYHAGLEREVREKIQNQFISGESRVIVATIAFGMGIDKADIRNIIHYNIPQSIENYYQEIGRAGRDGDLSNCILLFTKSDEFKIKDLISSSWPDERKIKNIISYLKNGNMDYFFTTTRKISFDCDVKEIPTNLILHRLEEAKAIKIFTNVFYQVKPLFSKSYSEIVEEHPKYKDDLEKIFSCEFFKNKRRAWLVFEEVMNQTGLNYFRILEIFNELRKEECLKFSEIMRKDFIWIKDKINDFDIAPLVNIFDSILNHDLNKVDLLIKSLTKQGCIRKNILEYFDELYVNDHCEMCSHCVGEKLAKEIEPEINGNYASDEEIERLVDLEIDNGELPLTLLVSVAQNKDIPESDFVKILTGSLHRLSNKWKFDLDCYGILNNFKNKEVVLEEVLKGLIDKELLNEEIDGTLRITRKGIKYFLDRKSIIKASPISINHPTTPILEEKNDSEEIPNNTIPDSGSPLDIVHEILNIFPEDHNGIQMDIENLLKNKFGFSVSREYETFTHRRGFIDLVAKRENYIIGIEIDRIIPKYKSIEKLNKINPTISFIVLRSKINENQYPKLRRRINSLKPPYIVISLYHKKILLQDVINFKESDKLLDAPLSTYHQRLEKLKLNYPQAYKSWTTEEEKQLTELFGKSKSVSEISKLMGRQSGGIKSRLRKLHLIKD